MRYVLPTLLLASVALLAYLRFKAPERTMTQGAPAAGTATVTEEGRPEPALTEIDEGPAARLAGAGTDSAEGAKESSAKSPDLVEPQNDLEFFPGRIVFDVLDASTRTPLGNVCIQEGPRRSAGTRSLPRLDRTAPLLVENEASPVSFQWPDGGSDRICLAHVFVDGYAPAVQEVHVVRGGRYTMPLEPAASLVVHLTSASSRKASLTIHKPGSKKPLISETVSIGEPRKLEGLPPGHFYVTAEVEEAGIFTAQEVTLLPGGERSVHMLLAPHAESSPIRLVIAVPTGVVPKGQVRAQYAVESDASDEKGAFEVSLDPASLQRLGSHDRFIVFTDEVSFGRGRIWIEELAVEGTFLHTPESPASVELRVASAGEVEVLFVDAVTEKPTPHGQAEIGPIVGNRYLPADELLMANSPGRFLAPRSGIQVMLCVPSLYGYLEAYARIPPTRTASRPSRWNRSPTCSWGSSRVFRRVSRSHGPVTSSQS
ncbi:MAG: hypothetical protein AAGG01_15460 [Planctomycetota bacterium]